MNTIESLHSIRMAAALLEGRDPSAERSRQIAGVIAFARHLIGRAHRVEVHTRYRMPSVTAANEAGDRWVEVLAFTDGGGYRVEFWQQRSDLERPPSPERSQEFGEADATRWLSWVGYTCESWLCRAENWRWLPQLPEPQS